MLTLPPPSPAAAWQVYLRAAATTVAMTDGNQDALMTTYATLAMRAPSQPWHSIEDAGAWAARWGRHAIPPRVGIYARDGLTIGGGYGGRLIGSGEGITEAHIQHALFETRKLWRGNKMMFRAVEEAARLHWWSNDGLLHTHGAPCKVCGLPTDAPLNVALQDGPCPIHSNC